MKSQNHLTLTGVVTRLQVVPERKTTRFVLVHNFGGKNNPLFLPCITAHRGIHDGQSLRVEAHLRACRGRIKAIVSQIDML